MPATEPPKRTPRRFLKEKPLVVVLFALLEAGDKGFAQFSSILKGRPAEALAVRDGAKHSAVNMAARYGNPRAVEALLAAGGDARNADVNGHTPIHHAVLSLAPNRKGPARLGAPPPEAFGPAAARTIRALLAAGADANARDKNGATPLALLRSARFAPTPEALKAGAAAELQRARTGWVIGR